MNRRALCDGLTKVLYARLSRRELQLGAFERCLSASRCGLDGARAAAGVWCLFCVCACLCFLQPK